MTSPTSDQSPAPRHDDTEFGGFDPLEMITVHKVFRREIPLMGKLIAAVAPGDVKRSSLLAAHLADVSLGLVHHHEGEDELIWPPMLSRVGIEREIVLRMEAQHQRIVETLDAVNVLVKQWGPTADPELRDRIVAALDEHRTVLFEHLDDEEAHLLPLAPRYLTAKEWGALGEHFVMSTPKTKLLKFFSMVMEDADERGRAILLGGMPAPARVVWRLVGQPMYVRTVRKIRVTA